MMMKALTMMNAAIPLLNMNPFFISLPFWMTIHKTGINNYSMVAITIVNQ